MPAIRWEWKFNILEVVLITFTMIVTGTVFYSQVVQNSVLLVEGQTKMEAQAVIVQSVKERTSILETKLDFLIDQNKEVISLLKR